MKPIAVAEAIFVCVLSISSAAAQDHPIPGPAFEAATVKPHIDLTKPDVMVSGGSCRGVDDPAPANSYLQTPLGRCSYVRASLKFMLWSANSGPGSGVGLNDMVTGGPAWAPNDLFDIEAKAEETGSVTGIQLREMLFNFVTAQFKLETHHESKELEVMALTIAKSGLKICTNSSQTECIRETTEGNEGLRFGRGQVVAEHITPKSLAGSLRGQLPPAVIDKTGVSKAYAFTLIRPEGTDSTWIRPALEDLGFRFQGIKISVDVIVIDHAEKPAP